MKKNIPMKRIILISLLIFNSLVALSRIETVNLVYDKNEVYKGNTFKVKLRVKSHRGKVYYSDVFNRYNIDKFKFGEHFKIVEETSEFLLIKVKETVSDGVIEGEIKYVFGISKTYNFKLRIINFLDELKSINLSLNSENVISNSIIDFSVVGKIGANNFVNFSETGKLKYDDIDIMIMEGGRLLSADQIRTFNLTKDKRKLRIKLVMKKKPSISSEFTFDIKYNPALVVNLKGANGANGLNGKKGLSKPRLFTGGQHGLKGSSGSADNSGKKGQSRTVVLNYVKDLAYTDSMIKVDIFNESNSRIYRTLFLAPEKQVLYINVSGGSGGDGGNGGNGENGFGGRVYLLGNEDGFAENGGDGGRGGNGNDGGNGGDGGDILIKYSNGAERFKEVVIIKSFAGRGGDIGNGGKGGGQTGRTGHRGRDGRAGRDGRDGTVRYVLIE